MRKNPPPLTTEQCKQATERCSRALVDLGERERTLNEAPPGRFDEFIRRDIDLQRKRFSEDPDVKKRMQRHFCIRCHYSTRLAGQAFTEAPCGLCGEVQTFSSTATDALCRLCAVAHRMCAHCAGDIDGDVNREDYPA